MIQPNYLETDLSIELDNEDNPEYIMLNKDTNSYSILLPTVEPNEIPQPPILVQVNTIKTTDDYILQFYFGSLTIVALLIYFRMLQKSL